MEFWAQRTVSPVDGRVGWTVGDDRYVEHRRAAEWLLGLLDAQGRSAGTARAYAGRLALYLTWAAAVGVDEAAPDVEQLAAFARWPARRPPSTGSWRAVVSSCVSALPGAGAIPRSPSG